MLKGKANPVGKMEENRLKNFKVFYDEAEVHFYSLQNLHLEYPVQMKNAVSLPLCAEGLKAGKFPAVVFQFSCIGWDDYPL